MNIRIYESKDTRELVTLIARFRQSLAKLRKKSVEPDLESAAAELAEYQAKGYLIYVAVAGSGKLVGYLVCRVADDVVWAESLYVLPEHRRQGIGSALYAKAEVLAEKLGGDTLYNWVDPTNDRIIRFLGKRGYNVLNLIEIRRPVSEGNLSTKIRVGENEFDHY